MLTNINSYYPPATNSPTANSLASNSRLETVQGSEESASSTLKTSNESAARAGNNVFLSSKAEKINAISAEFFKNGPLTSVDVDKLVERVYEYGLISKADYTHLGEPSQAGESLPAQDNTTMATLADFIDDFQQRFNSVEDGDKTGDDAIDSSIDSKATEPSNTEIEMNKALSSALEILADVEQAKKSEDFQQSLNHAIATLTEVVQSDSFTQLPLDDRAGLSKTVKALEVVDKLTPQRQNNKFINRYLDISLK